MIYRFLILTFLLLVACRQTGGPSEAIEQNKSEWITDLDLEGLWTYRTAEGFQDGGSIAMGFINLNGEILYVFYDFSSGIKQHFRHCRLQRTFDDENAIEILPKSELEQKVIALIENAQCSEELEKMLPNRKKAVEILKTRDLGLRFDYLNPPAPDPKGAPLE